MGWKTILKFAGVGIIVSLHWVAFYGSIKYSNVSVALSALATSSLFASIIEPLITRTRFRLPDMILGLLVIVGIWLIFMVTEMYLKGIIAGILAAFLAATFSSFNKRLIADHDSKSVTLIELGSGFLFLSLLLPFVYPDITMESIIPAGTDWMWLLLLGVGCTTLPFILSLNALRYISAFKSNLAINLEPVYGILMAALIFGENKELTGQFYVGTAVILAAVFAQPALRWFSGRFVK